MATEETTITELELAEEVLADMVIPVDTSTDTKSVSLKQLRAWLGSSLPTGFILPAVGKMDDERFTLLDGKTLSKQGTYGAFCAKVEAQVQGGNWFACSEEEYNADLLAYGQCGKFVIGTDYVRIPTITRFIGATITLSEIGKTYKESLPNITGYISYDVWSGGAGGAFYNNGGNKRGGTAGDGGSKGGDKGFSASLSSSTYQDGAKVQPDHTKYPYYMVISTEGQTAEVEIDINQVYEDLNLKANSDLSNVASVAQSFKNQSVTWGIPDYDSMVNINITSGTALDWTAPCDCFVHVSAQTTGQCVASIFDRKSGVWISRQDNVANASKICSATAIIDKGRVINIMGKGTINYCYYAPLKGVN